MIAETTVPSLAAWVPLTRGAATAIFSVALAVFLLTSGVRWVTLGESFYLDEFAKYHISRVTGLSNDELAKVARAFVTYFQSEPGRLDVVVNLPEGPTRLLNEREIIHMEDVQLLVQKILRLWTLSLAMLILSGIVIVAVDRETAGRAVLIASAIGGALAVFVIGALGVASLIDFERLFLQFHFMSFSNDFWLLDPRTDRLIQLYPEGFFYDSALRIALETVIGGAVIFTASAAALRFIER
jgi:integral membrane protein (TIGR01906 family)